jgi:osmoprotectant transport system substrate-binding protein
VPIMVVPGPVSPPTGQPAHRPGRGGDGVLKRGARWRGPLLAVAVAGAVLACCACGACGGTAATPPGRAPGAAVVVGSFNFPESVLLAAIYALALMQAGIPARLQLDLGPRELVQAALAQGVVDVVPEYLGAALASLESVADVAVSDPIVVRRELARVLVPYHVQVLQPAAAQDHNGLVVTAATAARLRLRAVSDLSPLAPQMVLGGTPECPRRPYCLPGLRRAYGLEFARFVPLATERERIDAVRQGVVDVTVTGTTSGYLANSDLVLLADDRQLQPADNIVPVVRAGVVARHGARLAEALDAVSARLTTDDLILLNWRVTIAGQNVLAEARAWLERQGIVPEPG